MAISEQGSPESRLDNYCAVIEKVGNNEATTDDLHWFATLVRLNGEFGGLLVEALESTRKSSVTCQGRVKKKNYRFIDRLKAAENRVRHTSIPLPPDGPTLLPGDPRPKVGPRSLRVGEGGNKNGASLSGLFERASMSSTSSEGDGTLKHGGDGHPDTDLDPMELGHDKHPKGQAASSRFKGGSRRRFPGTCCGNPNVIG